MKVMVDKDNHTHNKTRSSGINNVFTHLTFMRIVTILIKIKQNKLKNSSPSGKGKEAARLALC